MRKKTYLTSTVVIAFAFIVLSASEQTWGQRLLRRGNSVQRSNTAQPSESKTVDAGPTTPAPSGPATHVLIVGVGSYAEKSLEPVPGADFDAGKLAVAFENAGVHRGYISVVGRHRDKSGRVVTAGKERILNSLNDTVRKLRHEDSLVVYLIGRSTSQSGSFFFCPADAKENDTESMLELSDLINRIDQNKATHKVLVFDAIPQNDSTGDPSVTVPEKVWFVTTSGKGEFPMRESDLSVNSRESTGLFNHFVVQGLEGKADLIGNNDGETTLFELFNYAAQNVRRYAGKKEIKQSPRLFGSQGANFTIGKKGSSSMIDLRSYDQEMLEYSIASRSAEIGNDIIQTLQSDLQQAFRGAEDRQMQQQSRSVDVREYLSRHQKGVSFAVANFIDSALELDPKNRLALLARAFAFRATGEYSEALADYYLADEAFELFVIEKTPKDEAEASASGNDLTIDTVPLYENPTNLYKPFGEIGRGEKVFVLEIKEGRTRNPEDQWLRVLFYMSEDTALEGWIHRDYVYWCPEAADWYTPLDKLGKMYKNNEAHFANRAKRFGRGAQAAARISRFAGALGSFGVPHMGTAVQVAEGVHHGLSLAQSVAWSRSNYWKQVGKRHVKTLSKVGEQSSFLEAEAIRIDLSGLMPETE